MASPIRPPPPAAASRTAWLVGASGLIGSALLPLLQTSPRYAQVHLLLRRAHATLADPQHCQIHVVDFAALPADLPPADDIYIALGTTIKIAGSEAAFRQVDFDFVVNTARAARGGGAQRLAVVSALGADSGSRVFYNRVKGEMQAAIAQLGYSSVVIAQPSLLLGDRAALGQRVRSGEVWATRLLGPLMALVPASVRPIGAAAVAAAMVQATLAGAPGVRILSSREMQNPAPE